MADVSATFRVEGLASLDAALRDLSKEVAGPIMQTALEEAGEVIRREAANNIHSRSGRTAADLRVTVQVEPEKTRGVAAVGGTVKGRTGREYVLRFLEFGTLPHKIVGGSTDRKLANKATRALKRMGNKDAIKLLRGGIRSGDIKVRRALKFGGGAGIFRRAVNHPGIAPQAPLTRALAEHGERATQVLMAAIWREIKATVARLPKGGSA